MRRRSPIEWQIRLALSALPFIGHRIETRSAVIPPAYGYIVKHQALGLYWRDPYQLRTNAGDPRSDWGKRHQAWHFVSEQQARDAIQDQQVRGLVLRVMLREGQNVS